MPAAAAQKLIARLQDALLFLARFPVVSRLTVSSSKAAAPARLRLLPTAPSTLRRTECDGYQPAL